MQDQAATPPPLAPLGAANRQPLPAATPELAPPVQAAPPQYAQTGAFAPETATMAAEAPGQTVEPPPDATQVAPSPQLAQAARPAAHAPPEYAPVQPPVAAPDPPPAVPASGVPGNVTAPPPTAVSLVPFPRALLPPVAPLEDASSENARAPHREQRGPFEHALACSGTGRGANVGNCTQL